MSARTTDDRTSSPAYKAMIALEMAIAKGSIEKPLRELVKLHVSQINGCAYCIDMHWKDARADGEAEHRLYSLPAWRETPYYSDRERAALLLAEKLTDLAHHPVSETVFEEVCEYFNERELVDLAFVIAAINGWNRLNVALQTEPGTYEPPR